MTNLGISLRCSKFNCQRYHTFACNVDKSCGSSQSVHGQHCNNGSLEPSGVRPSPSLTEALCIIQPRPTMCPSVGGRWWNIRSGTVRTVKGTFI
jgi:hypothetical protein